MPNVPRDDAGRPILDPLLTDFATALAEARPGAFGHIEPAAVLFVAGAARRHARASIRGFPDPDERGPRPPEIYAGRDRVRYEVCLRPRFFLDADPATRARILAHELWHIGPDFDGHLDPTRRHGGRAEAELEADLDRALGDFDAHKTPLWRVLREPGERRLAAWRVRPPGRLRSEDERARYDADDLFSAIVLQL